MVLENEITTVRNMDRTYDDQFAIVGAKIGSTVNVRRPGRFIGTTGPNLNVEDFNETSIPVTLTTQFHVDTQFITQDLALSLDMFSDRVIKPMVAAVANKADRDACVVIKNNTANIVGVAGTPPTGLITYLTAGAYLDAEGTPRDGNRAVIVEPFTAATIVDSLKGLFVPQTTISEQFRKGLMGRDSAGMNWYLDQNVVSHTFGFATSAPTITMNASTASTGCLASGWASSSTINITSSQTFTFNQGDVIQIAGVYAVNPQNRGAYGSNKLRNFVVTSGVSAVTGNQSITVSPAIIYGGQFQNVTAVPANSAAVTPFSMASSAATAVVSPQNFLMHKNAFTFVMADLELPEGVHFAGRASDAEMGLSLRIVRQYTVNNDAIPTRCDVLYGIAPLYPELACRVAA